MIATLTSILRDVSFGMTIVEGGSMFLKNYWYVAAWSSEVSAEPLARIFLGEPVVLNCPKGNH